MSELARARLIPIPAGEEEPTWLIGGGSESELLLDFNPNTLVISLKRKPDTMWKFLGLRVQFVGPMAGSLSFEAIFDTTRPRPEDGPGAVTAEMLDVRRKTRRLYEMLSAVADESKSETSFFGLFESGEASRRVRFLWGTIVFDGILESLSETLEFFSPEGVPLRAKVAIKLREQVYNYKREGGEAQLNTGSLPPATAQVASQSGDDKVLTGNDSRKEDTEAGAPDPTLARELGTDIKHAAEVARQSGKDSLLALKGATDLVFDAVEEAKQLVDAVDEALAFVDDVATAAQAGLDLAMDEALDVFGGDLVGDLVGDEVDLGRGGTGDEEASPAGAPGGNLASAWAPDGPAPGTRANEIAKTVTRARAAGQAADQLPRTQEGYATAVAGGGPSGAPQPVRGSPPQISQGFGPPPPEPAFARAVQHVPQTGPLLSGRPSWEVLRPATPAADESSECCSPRRKRW